MKYAVEARIFSNGKIVAKVREAEEWEKDTYKDTRSCDLCHVITSLCKGLHKQHTGFCVLKYGQYLFAPL